MCVPTTPAIIPSPTVQTASHKRHPSKRNRCADETSGLGGVEGAGGVAAYPLLPVAPYPLLPVSCLLTCSHWVSAYREHGTLIFSLSAAEHDVHA